MIRIYADYYRHYGLRRAMQLVAPKLSPINQLSLPKQSILHYMPVEGEHGISSDDYILRGINGPLYAHHVIKLTEKRGNPRSSMVSVNKIIRAYHRKYRKIRKLNTLERVLHDKRSTIIENYAILPDINRYPVNIYRPYNKWFNLEATLFDTISKLAEESDRHQFLECRLPAILPSRSILKRGTGKVTTRFMRLFPDPETLFILEMWKWLGEEREESIFTRLSPKALEQLNLIWMESGKWFTVNLALLNSWRRPTDSEIAKGAERNIRGIPPRSLQNRFLRLLMFLYEGRSLSGGEEKPLTEEAELEEKTVNLDEGMDREEDTSKADEEEDSHQTIDVPVMKEKVASIKVELTTDDGSEKEEEIKLEPGVDLSMLPIDAVEETEENNAKIDAIIEKDLEALDHLHLEREKEDLDELTFKPEETGIDEPPLDVPALKDITLEEGVVAKADQLADMGLLSGAEYRRFMALSKSYKTLPNPYTEKGSLEDLTKIPLEDLELSHTKLDDHIGGVSDPSMLKSTLVDYDKKYIEKVLPKDVAHSVLGVQKAGIAVTGYHIEEHQDAMNHYEAHSVQLTPVRGKTSTVHFRLPKVREDGTLMANGVTYRLAKQRVDCPIRKTKPDTVALTSYYAKVFVSRSHKKKFNYENWIANEVRARGMDGENEEISQVMLANVYDSNIHVPRIYSILAQSFRSFSLKDIHLFFDYHSREKIVNKDALKKVEKGGAVFAGTKGKKKAPVIIGADDVFYEVGEGSDLKVLGSIEELLGLPISKAPQEITDIKIHGKMIPVGLFLAYILGFSQLLKILKVKAVREVPQGERVKLGDDEFSITFEDSSWVFVKRRDKVGLILQGLASLNQYLSSYPGHLYEKKAIYYNILDRMGLGVRYLREMDLMVDMFIDPITKEILESMKEPTTFVGLVVRSCELLERDWAPDESDSEHQRFRGYERMAGAVYQELVRATRLQRARGTNKAAIEINPYAVWQSIMQDGSMRLVEESNPVHELKGQEEVTYSGTGGRTSRSLVGKSRVFHPHDLGVISESTKDSGDVAVTSYLTADPRIKGVRGLTEKRDAKDIGAASLISTSMLLAPAADRDDAKRSNYVSIQNSSSTFCKGMKAPPLRTGYEKVVSHRTSDMFAYTAKDVGKVTKKTDRVIEISYKDGSKKSIPLGIRYGVTPDFKIPHPIVTHLKEGDKLKKGDIVTYNTNYFVPDPLDPKQVISSMSALLNVALFESPETLEDSSMLSERGAKLLGTQMAKTRNIVLEFKQAVHEVVKEGDWVEVDSPLCVIEDPVTAEQGLFDEDTLDTLKLIAANNPKAKMAGKIGKVEVFYHGDMDELSPSLQDMAHDSDLKRKRLAKEMGVKYTSGQVDDSMRVDGKSLLLDHAVIRITIVADVPMGVGDKSVYANQMKSICSRVMSGVNETESGEPLDAVFSYTSFSNRLVSSPDIIGTTNTLLTLISKKAAEIYFGK